MQPQAGPACPQTAQPPLIREPRFGATVRGVVFGLSLREAYLGPATASPAPFPHQRAGAAPALASIRAIRPLSNASGGGGQPGIVRSTGRTEATAPTQA